MNGSVHSAIGESPAHAGLSLRNIGKTYHAVNVLHDVNMDVRPGEVVALLGENGAGKSTLSSIIAGLVPADPGGLMWWQGKPYTPSSPGDALRAGIGLIHQEMRLLPHLSIAENVFVGRLPMKRGCIDMARMVEQAQRQLQRLGMNIPATRQVGTLRVAAQQQVEIAKALTLNARLLILDEPTAALGDEETDRLFEQIRRLKAEGVSFIYISHRLAEIARIADRIVVLRDGHQVAQHDTAQKPTSVLVRDMVGRNVDRLFPHTPLPSEDAPVVLEISQLSATDASFSNISFTLRAGEIFGLAGIVGAGRTELVRAIAGIDAVSGGEIRIAGEPVAMHSPRDAIRKHLVLVPDDRKALGVVLEHTISDNLLYNNFDQVAPDGWVRPQKAREFAKTLIEHLSIKGAPEQQAGTLSGGNQQKMVIAKWIARTPKIIILDEPTRGIDVGARAAIYETIAGLAKSGMAVIIVSSDLEEVLGLSHRILVMSRGKARGILQRDGFDSQKVMELSVI